MFTYNGKDVYQLKLGTELIDASNVWSYSNQDYSVRGNYDLYPCKESELVAKYNSLKSTLTPNSTLYFSCTSDFPRFKLVDSGYKRCIKPEKADYVVMGKFDYSEITNGIILEDEKNLYFLNLNRMRISYRCNDWTNRLFRNNPVSYIKDKHLYYGDELKVVYQGTLCYAKSKTNDLVNIMTGVYKKIITDKELDTAVNGNFDTLDAEALASICDMLDSPDKTTQGVGLKVLTGYNVNATPLAVRTILGLRESLSFCSEWKSVGVQQVLNSINWKGFGRFPDRLWNILPNTNDLDKYTDEDKNLVKDVYLRATKYFMDYAKTRVENAGLTNIFNWNITYDIKEN